MPKKITKMYFLKLNHCYYEIINNLITTLFHEKKTKLFTTIVIFEVKVICLTFINSFFQMLHN